MPLEGHWERLQSPLQRRERTVIAVVAAALAAAAIVVVLMIQGTAPASAGCVDATIASTTGGAAIHACGDQARRLCGSRSSPAAVLVACRRAGFAAPR